VLRLRLLRRRGLLIGAGVVRRVAARDTLAQRADIRSRLVQLLVLELAALDQVERRLPSAS
jgi:hypothetical protein